MKKVFGFACSLLILLFGVAASAVDTKIPNELSLTYEFVEGGPSQSATHEKYTVSGNSMILETEYIPTQYGSDISKKTKDTKTYKLASDQMNALWQVITTSAFMDWPTSEAQRPAMSGNQTVMIKVNGKTASHSMWEPANESRFIDFSREFLNWAKKVMQARF
jgi:hypothetical protein